MQASGSAPVTGLRAELEELEELGRIVDRVIDRDIEPYVDAWEAAGSAPLRELIAAFGSLGCIGVDVGEAHGGAGLGFLHAFAIAERLGRIASLGLAAALAGHMEHAVPLLHLTGSRELRDRWLPPMLSGVTVACAEPFDATAVPALRELVAGAPVADVIVRPGTCESNTEPVALAPRQLGSWSIPLGTITAREPAASVEPRALEAWRTRCRILEAGRSLRWMERLIAQTRSYTGQRLVFGKPLLNREAIRLRLAELQTEIDALRALSVEAATRVHAGHEDDPQLRRLAAGAQWKSARLQHRVADECLQFWGGMGFMAESPTARAWRESIFAAMGRQAPLLAVVAEAMEQA